MKSILLTIILCFGALNIQAQNIERKGNTFTQVSTTVGNKEIKTQYTFEDKKGNKYVIYLSSKGKAYIKKVSKKSGREYKQYLPDVGKKINPEAYKNDKS